jgi:hypothetical protein
MSKMLGRSIRLGSFVCALVAVGCAGSTKSSGSTGSTIGGEDSGTSGGDDTGSTMGLADTPGGIVVDSAIESGGGGPTVSVIYAHTDDTLYKLDPTTKNITTVGAFTFASGAGEAITDLAVKGDGSVYVNSTGTLYSAVIPASGTGSVALTKVTTLGDGTTKFYALGFTPAGYLGATESLIAGDGNGDLYLVDTSTGKSTLLGGFGNCTSGDPCGSGDTFWALSGDVVFYSDETSGAVRGLATLRSCSGSGKSTSCSNGNDVLAEIDTDAMKTAATSGTAASTLRKAIVGGGSGFGRLFGIGAWDANVYAFTRYSASMSSGEAAQLIQIDGSGTGTSIKTFSMITSGPCAFGSGTCSGFSGAGVTTKAKVTVVK